MPSIQQNLTQWMQGEVLPFWAQRGQDPQTGLFFERLEASGAPDRAANLRLRVQFRQIYVFAHTAVLGWYPDGADIALRAWQAVQAHFSHPEGGFIHLADPAGQVLDPKRDAYDHAFALLALAWLFRATGDPQVRAAIDTVLAYVDRTMTSPEGGLLEGVPHALPRRQNPQMHWFEAMLALHAAFGHPQAHERAAKFRLLLEEKLFDPQNGTLGEYFTQDWRDYPGPLSGSVEPGHHAEWAWLLRTHDRQLGAPPSKLARQLLETACRCADPKTGLLVDEADRSLRIRRGTRRAWLQTELAKAWLSEAEIGRPGARAAAVAALEALDRHYLRAPFAAGWIDQLDAQGNPIPGPVPAGILYHMIVAIMEADRVLGANI